MTLLRRARFAVSFVIVELVASLRHHISPDANLLWLARSHWVLDPRDRERDDVGKRAVSAMYRLKAKRLIVSMEGR